MSGGGGLPFYENGPRDDTYGTMATLRQGRQRNFDLPRPTPGLRLLGEPDIRCAGRATTDRNGTFLTGNVMATGP